MATAIGIITALMLFVPYAGEPTTEPVGQIQDGDNAAGGASPIAEVESFVIEAVVRRCERENLEGQQTAGLVRRMGVEIVELRRADCLLDASRVGNYGAMPKYETPVYLVHAIAGPGWWRLTTHHVLVLVKRREALVEMLHFSGGWGATAYRLESIGSSGRKKYALVIEDHTCGNHQSRTRLHMFCYDEERDTFAEVFDAVVAHSFSPTGGDRVAVHFDSDCSFRESGGDVKDLVVLTRLQVYPPRWQDALLGEMETVFHWDGERYAGELKVPGAMDD